MNAKEVSHIILAIILFAFIIWFPKEPDWIVPSFTIAFIVIFSNVVAKKIAAYYFQTTAELSIWHFQRWGYYTRSHFKKAKPIGIILPFLLFIASLPTGFIKMLTFLQTDIQPTVKRFSKRRGGLNRYSEITEWHNGWIVGIGIITNICLCFLPHLFGKSPLLIETAKYGVYYAVWNMLPLGQLDGTKIFFINWKFWIFMWALVFLGVAFII